MVFTIVRIVSFQCPNLGSAQTDRAQPPGRSGPRRPCSRADSDPDLLGKRRKDRVIRAEENAQSSRAKTGSGSFVVLRVLGGSSLGFLLSHPAGQLEKRVICRS